MGLLLSIGGEVQIARGMQVWTSEKAPVCIYVPGGADGQEPLVRKRRDNRQIGLGNEAENRKVKIRRETWRRYLSL
jgi:hypothetical protein